MRRSFWSSVILIFAASFANAQDQTNFTQFYINPYLYNPSYVGIDGQSALSIIYKKQWMTIDGGPTIANVTLQTPITPRAGFGLSITNDARGLLNNSSVLLTFGYNVALADKSFLRFGISGGGTWNTLDMTKLESMSDDPALANILENNASLTGNAGISLHIKTFQLGASMPTIFEPSYMSDSEFSITEIKPFQSIIVNASNRFYFGDDKHIFEPYGLYRINANLPPQWEAAGILHLNHVIWVGGSYKQDFGISALAGLKVKNALAIGASYSLQNSGANELNSPSFEVSLNLLFGKRKKDAPVYSFVNSVKEKEKKPVRKSASEVIAEKRKAEEEARKKQQAELAKKKKEEEEARQKAEALEKKAREEQAELARQQEAERVRQEEAERQRQAEEARAREEELAKKTEPVVKEPETTTPVVTPPVRERHETFRRGAHPKELAGGDYIIAGVFSSEANASRYTNGLLQLGYGASFGYLTEKKLWYVWIYRSDDIEQARVERDKFRKLRMFKDAWLLTIVE
ncbi:MAG TPA: PorP/SprF family type IX secretion system membrane protein [Chryseosolibacter sp.]|nr:PorP/SprF family type IX secretion system membrane protein [Chryseosolibacter sp.]